MAKIKKRGAGASGSSGAPKKAKKEVRASKIGPNGKRKMRAHRKHKWTPLETIDLVKAVNQYHEGKTFLPFAQILADMNFQFHPDRTSLHLGDKWKRLKTQYADKYDENDVESFCDYVTNVEKEKRKQAPTASLHRRTHKMARKRWSTEEVEALKVGHGKHGNKWATILRENRSAFEAKRTTMDLKDKWRNMQPGNKRRSKKKSTNSATL